MDDKREQVAKQCEVVCHLACALAEVHRDYAVLLRRGSMDNLIDQVGNRTACFMEAFGDFLNGMDAVEEEDEWVKVIFQEAHKLWPQAASHLKSAGT